MAAQAAMPRSAKPVLSRTGFFSSLCSARRHLAVAMRPPQPQERGRGPTPLPSPTRLLDSRFLGARGRCMFPAEAFQVVKRLPYGCWPPRKGGRGSRGSTACAMCQSRCPTATFMIHGAPYPLRVSSIKKPPQRFPICGGLRTRARGPGQTESRSSCKQCAHFLSVDMESCSAFRGSSAGGAGAGSAAPAMPAVGSAASALASGMAASISMRTLSRS